MEIITKRTDKEKQRNAGSEKLPQPQLLDSPLPTPRRSCASADAPSSLLRCRAGAASPLRTQVPFSWESSPGVPKSGRDARAAREEMPPPKPPPGRWPPQGPASRTNWCYTSEGSSDDCDASSFSDAVDRASSSPERIGSFDRVTSKRFEDIFLGRAESFAAPDRSCGHALAAAGGADIARSGRHSMHWRRRGGSTRHRHDDNDMERQKSRQSNGPVQVLPRADIIAARVEQMAPGACGLMVFFPWSAKPAVSGFRSSSTRHGAPRSGATDHSISHSRRNTTLRDALQVDNKTDDIDVQDSPPQPRREKRGREERQGARAWGVSSLLHTSKRYCTDARKALSKLSIGMGADSGSPRLGRDRSSVKQDAVMAAKLTKLKINRN
ncbi:uncharacterized protein [Lolium perenne]|uniref:uncharacterized protein n=1 Tax=Lolium perenne TaxID=4522 RepID=UPI0021EA36CA|nr:uncharacterized protein LOC127338731 [Lolium perenne]